jgi:hypothetical protein
MKKLQEQFAEKIIKRGDELSASENNLKPIIDGLTNPEIYAKASPKIMFILKEAYEDEGCGGGWNHAEYLNEDEVINATTTHIRVSRITTGIYHDLTWDSDKWKSIPQEIIENEFKSLSWLNVGKFPAPAGTTTSNPRLWKVYQDWKDILFDQIESFDPDIIIFGNTFFVFYEDIIDTLRVISKDGPTHIYLDNKNRLLLDAYHPGMRGTPVSLKDYFNSIIYAVRETNFRNKEALKNH